MIRISLPYIWQLAEAMEVIERLEPTKPLDNVDLALELYGPQAHLEGLLDGSVFSPTLRSSRPLAVELLGMINGHTQREDLSGKAQALDIWRLRNLYGQFKTAFLAELGTFPNYFVSQKGDRDTLTLLDQPWRMFPAELGQKVPEATFDIAEAGKALCFERSTACGFHVFRATEAVLRRYYSHVTGGSPQPKVRNIMVYVHAMRQRKLGDERILASIEQMSKLHRNPLIHPEAALSLDEALSILGMAHSAISAMLAVLPSVPQTTTTTAAASVAMTP